MERVSGRATVALQVCSVVALLLAAAQGGAQSSLERNASPQAGTSGQQTGSTTPAWGSPGATTTPGSTIGAIPRATNKAALAAGAAAPAPPTPRNCAQLITQPNPSYITVNLTHWYTDGTEDNGQILNQINGGTRLVQGDLNDLQIRIAQLACEDQNIEDKLDYLIRRSPG
jgi:hypothetical protein